MKVKELKDRLNNIPDDSECIIVYLIDDSNENKEINIINDTTKEEIMSIFRVDYISGYLRIFN
jgi:hypothetical protein